MATTLYCVICGEGLQYRNSFGRGKNYPICKKKECFNKYMSLRTAATLPLPDETTNPEGYHKQKESERHDGFCGRCGKPIWIDCRINYYRHNSKKLCEKAPAIRNSREPKQNKSRRRLYGHKEPQPKPRIYLKPWQDPQSLFCDTTFLETKILKKKIRKGTECRTKK